MSTISEELNLLLNTKNALKQSLINKEVEVSDADAFDTYPAKIDNMKLGIPTYNSLEELQAVQDAVEGDMGVIETQTSGFDGIYKYDGTTWNELFSARRYEGTMTPEEYTEANETASDILGV